MKHPIVHLQEGSLAEIEGILKKLSAFRLFFVVDENAYQFSGAADVLEPIFAEKHLTKFSDFEPNPNLRDIERGIERFETADADVVIALGGGTAIDMAKSITRLAGQKASPREILVGNLKLNPIGPPIIAIPTTSGTGSEATHFAVVYVDGVKYSLTHESILPDFALIDPLLTYSLPAEITASSGLDAMCQAVESFWAVGATETSIDYAKRSLKLVLTHLSDVVSQPTPAARRGMSEAAHFAGCAINLGKTTAPHALSYAVTIQYGISHGPAVALTLPMLLRYNARLTQADCNDPRGSDHVRRRIEQLVNLLGCSDVQSASECLENLIQRVGGPLSFSEIGIVSDKEIEQLAVQVNLERLSNNPRALNADELRKLLLMLR